MPRAPRRCPTANCDNLITSTKHCPDHAVGWARKNRTASSALTNTAEWKQLRATVLKRDNY